MVIFVKDAKDCTHINVFRNPCAVLLIFVALNKQFKYNQLIEFQNSNKMKKQLIKKGYAFIVTAMMFSVSAHTQIVYTDVDPDLTITQSDTGSVVQGVDINNDGIIDINMTAAWGEGYSPQWGFYTTKRVDVGCSAGSQLLMYYYFNVLVLAQPLSNTALIDSASQTWSDILFGAVLVVNVIGGDAEPFGDWSDTTDRYLGIRIPEGGDWLYGWVRVSVAQDSISFTIRDYAYNSIPNQPILAGQTVTTGIIENSFASAINLFPNPATNHLTIALPDAKEKVKITITDVTGKIIYAIPKVIGTSETQNIEVNINDFAAGMYVVQIQSEEFIETKKFIVKK